MKTTCCNSKKITVVERHAICINPKCNYYLSAISTASNLSLKNKSMVVLAITFLLTLSLEDFSRENNEFKPRLRIRKNEGILKHFRMVP